MSRVDRQGRIRSFADHWARAGMPPTTRLDHAITWNRAIEVTTAVLAERYGLDADQARAAVEGVRAPL